MQLSSLPARISAIFAASAPPTSVNVIPLTQTGITQPGQASYDVGFPAVTMQPASSGGINPYGQDFNGLGNVLTAVQQWQSAGGLFPYDATFSSAIGGYPKGAFLLKAGAIGMWQSTVDNNTTNPDTGGAGWISVGIASGIAGQQAGAKAQVTTPGTSVTYTADELIVESSLGGLRYCLPSFSKTLNVSTTGAGGMDTGSAPASGYVGIYAIYNPATGANALLGVSNTTAKLPTIYGGANMPSGYAASALMAVWPTNGSSQLIAATLIGRRLVVPAIVALSSATTQASFTSLTIPIPANAMRVKMNASLLSSTANAILSVIPASDVGGSGQSVFQSVLPVAGNSNTQPLEVDIYTAQTIYYKAASSAGTPSFSLNISSYDV